MKPRNWRVSSPWASSPRLREIAPLAGETLEAISEPRLATEDRQNVDGDEPQQGGDASYGVDSSGETRVTGLLEDRKSAKRATEELNGAGFTGASILIAMQNEADQKSLVEETRAQALAQSEAACLPSLGSGQVLILIEAAERAAEALNILDRNKAVTGGVRIPSSV